MTNNLWGERWSKLVANAMQNGLSACTGLGGGDMLKNDPIRHFSTRVGSEAIRVGQALGYALEEILHLPPETIARAGEGDEAAMRTCDAQRFKDAGRTAAGQRPSMGQDMQKGRRTEIEFLNGLIAREGEKVGAAVPRQRGADRHRQAGRARRAQGRSEAHHRAAVELSRSCSVARMERSDIRDVCPAFRSAQCGLQVSPRSPPRTAPRRRPAGPSRRTA